LPDWRKDSKNVVDVPEDIKEALAELLRKYQEAASTSDAEAVATKDLAFAQVTRRIKPLKGDYFRIAKDLAVKADEEENKASATILPQGTASATLAERLARLTADVKCSNIELFRLRRKFDENDQPVVRDGVLPCGLPSKRTTQRERLCRLRDDHRAHRSRGVPSWSCPYQEPVREYPRPPILW
jgi:hypothetical protein